jgi:hypothetical protein
MSEIPEDIRKEAGELVADIRDCAEVFHYDEGDYGCEYGIDFDYGNALLIIARALFTERIAERERCAKIADVYSHRDTGRDIASAIRNQESP